MEALGVCRATVTTTRKKYSEKGDRPILDRVADAPRSGRPLKVDSRVEAQLTMLACSDPPEGAAKWTLRLLAVDLPPWPRWTGEKGGAGTNRLRTHRKARTAGTKTQFLSDTGQPRSYPTRFLRKGRAHATLIRIASPKVSNSKPLEMSNSKSLLTLSGLCSHGARVGQNMALTRPGLSRVDRLG